jgi:Calx-beta domain
VKRIGTRLGALLVCSALALTGLSSWAVPPALAATPGGVFVTGHDPDFHAGTQGGRNIIQRAVAYVTYGKANPRMLLVTGVVNPGPNYLDPRAGVRAAGFRFDVADHGSGAAGALNLRTVNFSNYDVIVVASDFGGWLRQAELDILNDRSGDIINFINGGGGLIAFAESGSGGAALTTRGRFGYLPFLVSDVPLDQEEAGFTLTPEGEALGLKVTDINGNYSHNIFMEGGGLNVIDVDSKGNPMSLAARGLFVAPGGVPTLSISDVAVTENVLGGSNAVFTVTLSLPIPGPATVEFATADGSATAPVDYEATTGTLTIDAGKTTGTIIVPVKSDLAVEPDETFTVRLSGPSNANVEDGEGIGTIRDVVPLTPASTPNRPPVCTGATASPASLAPADHRFEPVTLSGVSDPDGDLVSIEIISVTQDEPLIGTGPGDDSPDARRANAPNTVQLRAERADAGDGRLYTIGFIATDGKGGRCTGKATVGVPRDGGASPVDSGLQVNSFESAQVQIHTAVQVLPEQLPRTGAPVRGLTFLGGALLVGGLVGGSLLLAAARRRRVER